MTNRCWTIRLKRDISPSQGLVKGLTLFNVVTQQDCHDYPTLRKALRAAGYSDQIGGCDNDTYWEWS